MVMASVVSVSVGGTGNSVVTRMLVNANAERPVSSAAVPARHRRALGKRQSQSRAEGSQSRRLHREL